MDKKQNPGAPRNCSGWRTFRRGAPGGMRTESRSNTPQNANVIILFLTNAASALGSSTFAFTSSTGSCAPNHDAGATGLAQLALRISGRVARPTILRNLRRIKSARHGLGIRETNPWRQVRPRGTGESKTNQLGKSRGNRQHNDSWWVARESGAPRIVCVGPTQKWAEPTRF
jgi:hypothetical protein